jgi:hypothetical protein
MGLDMPALSPPDGDTKVYVLSDWPRHRALALASVGIHLIAGSVPIVRPQPCFSDWETAVEGAWKRFVSENPQAEKGLVQELRAFVKEWLEKNLVPLDRDSNCEFEHWLANTNYPLWRKEELRLAHEQYLLHGSKLRPKDRKVKMFVKREQYDEYKYARDINSRSDVFKCFSGPIFKLIEAKLFKLDWFIKKIPVADRPEYILNRLQQLNGKIVNSDYTSFEALFTPALMTAVEMQLYEYMTKKLPNGRQWFQEIFETLTGTNFCWAKQFVLETRGRRMSGEMCTSLGNGFSNLMFMLFACHKFGSKCIGVIEGDDGLFTIDGPLPDADFFSKLGLRIKLGVHDDLATASFCGLVFDREDRINVVDVRKVLADFGWVDSRYAFSRRSKTLALLRCKALSLAHQYPGCPILGDLAQYGLKITSGINVASFIRNSPNLDWWQREQLLSFLDEKDRELPVKYREPPTRTRELVARLYGVSPAAQRDMENLLRSRARDDLSPIPAPVWCYVPAWIDYGSKYVIQADRPTVFPGPSRAHSHVQLVGA